MTRSKTRKDMAGVQSPDKPPQTLLSFKKPIISNIKSPIPTKELLVRLQTLSDELSSIDQDLVSDTTVFQQISSDLVNRKLLSHANVGVQAYACCAISDLLRINAPNAPFTAPQLSDVFKAFFRQFRRLGDPENPYFQQQCYLLKRLAEVRSVILITDLPNASELIELIFTTFYDLAQNGFPTKLEALTCDILSEIIAESEVIPSSVLKLVLNKFVNSDESRVISSNISNAGLAFSMSICEVNMDRMSRQVAQYCSEILYQEVAVETSTNLDPTARSSSLHKIHNLSVQIWKAIPELLTSVMGLIDDELNADDPKIRALATETIGRILGSSSRVNFFVAHRETWSTWLKKSTDISPEVRDVWVSKLPQIFTNNVSSLTSDVNISLVNCLYKCLLDTDERVRLAACQAVAKIPFSTFTSKICNRNIMNTLAHLIREKHVKIRNQAIEIFGSLYNEYYQTKSSTNGVIDFGSHDEHESEELEKLFRVGIHNQILSLVYINDVSINAVVDLCTFEKLLPVAESKPLVRVERIAQFYKNLDEKGRESFIAINRRQQQVSKVLKVLIDFAESKEPEDAVKLDKVVSWICVSFPENSNAYSCFERLVKMGKSRFSYLLKVCISPESDYNTVRNSIREILMKCGDQKNFKLEGAPHIPTSEMTANMKLLLLRSSVLLYNKSNIFELINFSKDPENKWYNTANELLDNVSTTIPDVFKLHIKAMTEIIINPEGPSPTNVSLPRGLQLRTIYRFIQKYPNLFPVNYEFSESLKDIAANGTPREAKYCIKILNLRERKEVCCTAIVNSIYPLDLKSPKFVTHLSSIAELFIVDPLSIQDKASEITELVIKEVFLQNRHIEADAVKYDNGWIDDDTLDVNYQLHSTLYEKLLALRLLVNRLRGMEKDPAELSEDEKQDIISNAQPVLKLLMSFIGNSGEIINKSSPSWPTPELYKSKIRLTAGCLLLKLAKYPIYSTMIFPTTLRRLTFLLTDVNEHVRSYFLVSLQRKLASESISERFLSIIFFSALEPVPEIRNNATMWIQSLFKKQRAKQSLQLEKSLIRVIHTLAHHEQSQENLVQALLYASTFITYFVTLIGTQDNISLLYYLASRVKQYRDATLDSSLYEASPPPSQVTNLYRVAELTQLILKEYSDNKGWTIQTWPGKLKLPNDIFIAMSSTQEAQAVVSEVFIPASVQEELLGPIRKKLFRVGTKRKATHTESTRTKVVRSTVRREKKSNINNGKEKKIKLAKTKSDKGPTSPSRKSSRSTKKVNYGAQLSGSESESESESEIDSESE